MRFIHTEIKLIRTIFTRAMLGLAVLFVLAAALNAYAAEPCCAITGIDQKSGTVTARENATRRVFTFKVTDAKLLSSLKVGQGVFANFTARQVSVNGFDPCCNITSLQPPNGAKSANAAPFVPCCDVTGVNANTGQVTVRENSSGRLITLKVSSLTASQFTQRFKVGAAVGFEPVDSAKLAAGSRIQLRAAGFDPVDSVVSQIAAH